MLIAEDRALVSTATTMETRMPPTKASLAAGAIACSVKNEAVSAMEAKICTPKRTNCSMQESK